MSALDRFYSWKGRIVFVSNIPFHCKAQDVLLVMRQFGRCFRVDLVRGEDGKSRGFGWAEFEKKESAERAAKWLDGAQFYDRFLRAELAENPPDDLIEVYKATARQRAEQDRRQREEEEQPKTEEKEKKDKAKRKDKEKKSKREKKSSKRRRKYSESSDYSQSYTYSNYYSDYSNYSNYDYSYSYGYSDSYYYSYSSSD